MLQLFGYMNISNTNVCVLNNIWDYHQDLIVNIILDYKI